MKKNSDDSSLLKTIIEYFVDEFKAVSDNVSNPNLLQMSAIFCTFLMSTWAVILSDPAPDRVQIRLLLIFGALIALMLFLLLARNYIKVNRRFEEPKKEAQEATKIKERYPSLSVIGVFLKRTQASQSLAENIISIPICLYTLATVFTPLVIEWQLIVAPAIFLVALILNGFTIKYRIRKGYYLNNERETRELIKFIKDNTDDIDFTSGNRRILSPEDLEDIVLRGTVGYNPM